MTGVILVQLQLKILSRVSQRGVFNVPLEK